MLPRSFVVRLVAGFAATLPAAAAPYLTPVRWHVEVGPSQWLNTRVAYGASRAEDPAATPRVDRFYDDGFNRVDASGNLGDGPAGPLPSRTGYFGFQRDDQVNLRAGTLTLTRTQLAEGPYVENELKAQRPAWQASIRVSLRRTPRPDRDWGAEAGINLAALRQDASGAIPAALRVLSDTYALGGVVPQRAPYAGRFSPLPGDQRIGDVPTRTFASAVAPLQSRRSLTVRTTMLHLGPWFEFGQARGERGVAERERWAVRVRAGLALLATRASFATVDQLSVAAPVAAAGTRSRTDLGAFAGLAVRRSFTPRWALVGGVDVLWGSTLTISQGNRYARIDLSQPLLVRVAAEYAFQVRTGER